MKSVRKTSIPLLRLILLALALPLSAQEAVDSAAQTPEPSAIETPSPAPELGRALRSFSRRDTRTFVSLASAIHAVSVLEMFAWGEAWLPPVFLGTVTAQGLPGLAWTPRTAGIDLGVQLGLDGLWALGSLAVGNPVLNGTLFNAAHKFSMFATYDSYMEMRGREAPADAATAAAAPRRHSFLELALAPFDPKALGHWQVLGNIGVLLVINGLKLAFADQSDAIWTRGTSFIGDAEFDPWIGIPLMALVQLVNFTFTGIGEESFYRGVQYQQMKRDLGPWPARFIDAAWFTASHYPQQWEVLKTEPVGQTFLNFGLSVADTLWRQYLYDSCGLDAAVANHAWGDVISFGSDWLLGGGVPDDTGVGLSLNGR